MMLKLFSTYLCCGAYIFLKLVLPFSGCLIEWFDGTSLRNVFSGVRDFLLETWECPKISLLNWVSSKALFFVNFLGGDN